MEETTASHATHHPVPIAMGAAVFFLALLAGSCGFSGGATSKWARRESSVAFLGAFLIFKPPRRSLGLEINATFLALLSGGRWSSYCCRSPGSSPPIAGGFGERFRNRFAF